jgi:hypothetical protein
MTEESIERRAMQGAREIRDVTRFAMLRASKHHIIYDEDARERDTALVLKGVIRRAIVADRRQRSR